MNHTPSENFPETQEDYFPHSQDLEAQLLGQILCNNNCFFEVDFVEPEDFYFVTHQEIFSLIREEINQGKTVNVLTICQKLSSEDTMDLGGKKYLIHLHSNTVTLICTRQYGEQLIDLSNRRKIIQIADKARQDAYNLTGSSAKEILDNFEQELHDASVRSSGDNELFSMAQTVDKIEKNLEEVQNLPEGKLIGVDTGLRALNEITGGLQKSNLIILGGRPSMGKTALATTIAKNAALSGEQVVFFSLEMDYDELGSRLVSDFTSQTDCPVSYFEADTSKLSQIKYSSYRRSMPRLLELGITIVDAPNVSTGNIRSRLKKLRRSFEKKDKKIGLVIIDYLQLMKPSKGTERRSKTEQITEISRELKNLSKEFKTPFLVLSQLSRNLESRDNKRPLMSDLRDSGAIEQDANVILFVHREEYFLENDEPTDSAENEKWRNQLDACKGVLDIIVAKQRKGRKGTVHTQFKKKTSTIIDA